jgi:virginiamycin B lyase
MQRDVITVLICALLARPIGELKPEAIIHLGKTADWVAVTDDAVWVGSTGPFAVHRIDPKTNKLSKTVKLPGEPCAGLTTGFGSLWVPLCPASLAKVDLKTGKLTVFKAGPVAEEGGIAASADSIWTAGDKLLRIDPATGKVRQTLELPSGSFNPLHAAGKIWITRADGSEITRVDAATGAVEASIPTGPLPRFLAAENGIVWTLNQGDGSLTRIEKDLTARVALGTPGKGGDIAVHDGLVWTTMPKMPLSCTDAATATLRAQWAGPGGDSLGIGHGAIWLTDYHGGTISRLPLADAASHCQP